jgi:hypothetical protein
MSFLSGYTGIGIPFGTKPAYPLDVGGNTRISGSVGIGTSPGYKLDVSGDSRVTGTLRKEGGGDLIIKDQHGVSEREAQFYNIDGTLYVRSDLNADLDYAGNINFQNGRLFIKSAGNVGIGTTNPTGQLTVKGSGSNNTFLDIIANPADTGTDSWAGQLRFFNSAGTLLHIIRAGSPNAPLTITPGYNGNAPNVLKVAGDTEITGNLTVGGYVKISGAKITYVSGGTNPSCPSGYMFLMKRYNGTCGGDAHCSGCSVDKWDTNPVSCQWLSWCAAIGQCCASNWCSVSSWSAALCIGS